MSLQVYFINKEATLNMSKVPLLAKTDETNVAVKQGKMKIQPNKALAWPHYMGAFMPSLKIYYIHQQLLATKFCTKGDAMS